MKPGAKATVLMALIVLLFAAGVRWELAGKVIGGAIVGLFILLVWNVARIFFADQESRKP